MTETFRIQMNQESAQLGITLSDVQMEQFYSYYEMLVEKNKVMNLTAITEENEVVTKHFSDSLSLFGLLKEMQVGGDAWYKTCNVIDVGTGAGFPGIPLKIVFPELKVTLLDSLNKRVKWLEEVCTELHLEGVCCVHGRAEDIGRQAGHREVYDPVSYTHLDVYKRQDGSNAAGDFCYPEKV